MLYSDAHLHVNPTKGLGAGRIARKFRGEGGWFIAIMGLPPRYYGFADPSVESYRRVLDLINNEYLKAKEEGIEAARFIGIHPAEVDEYYREGLKLNSLVQLTEEVLKLLEEAVKNNRLEGIGEVGRQHYSTSPERLVLSEIIMVRALLIARDYRVPVQLHLEQRGFPTAYSVKLLSEIAGVDASRVLIHHANLETAKWAEQLSIPFTAPIRHFNEEYALNTWKHGMFESDFIDDLSRPGSYAYPWDIPRVVKDYLTRGLISEEQAYKMLVDNVVKYFNVKPP
ncbi:MAG: TatD family hydrolase [Desulfurococcaceae archaeon]